MDSSSASFNVTQAEYDVFLSFNGDAGYKFASHLNAALRRAKIECFFDDEVLGEDEVNWQSRRDGIEQSKISVVIFSKGCVSSEWWLEELVKIMECKQLGQIVIPVLFYHIESQTGTSGDAFAELEERFKEKFEKVQRWKTALSEAANTPPDARFESKDNRSEAALVEEIVEHILKKLNSMYPSNNGDLVGVQSDIEKIESLLHIGSKDVCIANMVGIWGISGIGKTTIAQAVFDKIRYQFEDSYFLLNVGEASKNSNGLTSLRKKLLSTKVQHSNIEYNFIKQKLHQKKILIVFDDVTSKEQIEFIIGDGKCLDQRSRIIITATDEQVLKKCEIEDAHIHKVEAMFHHEALQLFSWKAFKKNRPTLGYNRLSNMIVQHAEGVPLVLKVLGSFLCGQTKRVWEITIKKLERIHRNIQEVLKLSYDGLDDDEKNIFLDIVCFLKWQKRNSVIDLLNANGFFAEVGLSDLIDKSLITISNNKIMVHDLIQKLGCEIIEQESCEDHSRRSRLRDPAAISDVFSKDTETPAIEGICLNVSKIQKNIQLNPHVFSKMCNLRFLKIYNSDGDENNIYKVLVPNKIESVSTELRYLCWHGCPLKSLQSNIHPEYLVALDMPYSNIQQLWTGNQKLDNLKSINLSHSKNLLKGPELSCTPNLEILHLEGCTSLLEISSSIQSLNKLTILNLRLCKSLVSLPTGIHSKFLRKVILSCCSKLKTFPDISHSTKELFLDGTAVEELPSLIDRLSRLVILDLKNCSRIESIPSNIRKLTSLEYLDLSGCSNLAKLPKNLGLPLCSLVELNLTDCGIMELPNNLFELPSLKSVLLGKNKFSSIPESISNSKLSYIDLGYCEELTSLPLLPNLLHYIDAHSCKLRDVSSVLSILFPQDQTNARVNLINCFKLDQNALKAIVEEFVEKIHHAIVESDYRRPSAYICLPGSEIPKWFDIRTEGSFIDIKLPSDRFNSKFVSFAMCAIVRFRNYSDEGKGLIVGCDCKLESKDGSVVLYHGTLRSWYHGTTSFCIDSDHAFLGYDYRMCYFDFSGSEYNEKNKVSIQFYVEDLNNENADCCEVKSCGVRLLYKESGNAVEFTDDDESWEYT